MHKLFSYHGNLIDEPFNARQEGKFIEGLEERVQKVLEMDDDDPQKDILAAEILDLVQNTPVSKDHKYVEPDEFENMVKEWGELPTFDFSLSDEEIYDRVYGAWLGRCAGCLLGKPVEMWERDRLLGLLKDTGNYPINYYISSDIDQELLDKYELNLNQAWINNVDGAPSDDDTDYTVLALKMMETYGPDFTPEDVAMAWLRFMPILAVNCGSRKAYRNFILGVMPPHSAAFRNPFRDLLGGQIRADFYGYITPGKPKLGAEFAWRDASISHTKSGVYGAMFIAAMHSAAAVTSDVEKIVRAGLAVVPQKSRLAESIREVLEWKKEGITWEEALDRIHTRFEKVNFNSLLTTASDMIISVALLYGELDLEKSIGIAVSAAFDTDCNGANVGSIVGMAVGAKALAEKWIKPLKDTLTTSIRGLGEVRISELAERTMKIYRKVKYGEENEPVKGKITRDKRASKYLQNIEEGDV